MPPKKRGFTPAATIFSPAATARGTSSGASRFEFAAYDRRGIVKHSTRVRIAEDRNGRRASIVADKLNQELEAQWRALTGGVCADQATRYEQARLRARSLGFDYLDSGEVLRLPTEQRLARLEALVTKGVANDPGARAALLGTEKRPVIMLSKLQAEHEALLGDQIKNMSPEQLRIWRTSRIRSAKQFVELVGDKPTARSPDTTASRRFGRWCTRRRCSR